MVGNVISIEGLTVKILMNENTNTFTYFYDGKTYKGVSIGEYVGIIRGPYKIVGKVEKEYLNDKYNDKENHSYSLDRFERIIEISVIGYFNNNKFIFGVKFLPLIFNEVVLLNEEDKNEIINYGLSIKNKDYLIDFGKSMQDDLKIKLPIDGLYNSHLGIFGNTGSGKSNTLAKLYTELFRHPNLSIVGKSKFIFLDFNGEYTKPDMFTPNNKSIIKLSTRSDNGDKIKITSQNFWDKETLSILFSATEKTQQPFISKMLEYYRSNDVIDGNVIKNGIINAFKDTYLGNNNKESHNLMKKIYNIVGLNTNVPFYNCAWHSNNQGTYYIRTDMGLKYFNSENFNIDEELQQLEQIINVESLNDLNVIDKLILLINFQFIHYLRYNNVQFDHINPLLTRVESSKKIINRTIEITNEIDDSYITIISFKNCNQEAKKILPLLLSKQLYQNHIDNSIEDVEIEKTCHLIIDEAHNILSEQSIRELESFKDYRLEIFEQIIKEGRKYGFYLTVSSQRPYDISPTIISQISNYFIHRLVNELDLKMLSNTINTLDSISSKRIPNLSPGQCVVTGNLFELPTIFQVTKLDNNESPNSDNANIVSLWKNVEI